MEDYTNMPLETLRTELEKIKSRKITTAVFIGVLIGIAVYAATHKSFLLTVLVLLFALRIGYSNAQAQKNLEAEIRRREGSTD